MPERPEIVAMMAASLMSSRPGLEYQEAIKHARELLAAVEAGEPDRAEESELTRLRARVAELEGDDRYVQGWTAALKALISQVEAWHAPHHPAHPDMVRMGHNDAISAARKLAGDIRTQKGLVPQPPEPPGWPSVEECEDAYEAAWDATRDEVDGPKGNPGVRAVLSLCKGRAVDGEFVAAADAVVDAWSNYYDHPQGGAMSAAIKNLRAARSRLPDAAGRGTP